MKPCRPIVVPTPKGNSLNPIFPNTTAYPSCDNVVQGIQDPILTIITQYLRPSGTPLVSENPVKEINNNPPMTVTQCT